MSAALPWYVLPAPTPLPPLMPQSQIKRREELSQDAPPLERYLAAAKEKLQAVYDRIYYGDVIPPVGAYRISYARCSGKGGHTNLTLAAATLSRSLIGFRTALEDTFLSSNSSCSFVLSVHRLTWVLTLFNTRMLELLSKKRVKRIIMMADGRLALIEASVENACSDYHTITYDRNDIRCESAGLWVVFQQHIL